MLRIAIAWLLIMGALSAAQAERRVALVIGNSAYRHAPALANPRNDAEDFATALQALGVEVIKGIDLDKPAMDLEIRKFSSALSGADVGIFFYAGHGLQVSGNNYLVPIDAELSTTAALEFEMVRLDLVQRIMEVEVKTNILFLDACRDNPLSRNLSRALGTRSASIGKGLATAESGVGTLISFSTQPGNVALDGKGRNSPYTGPLVRRIGKPGEDVLSVLTDVRNDVLASTGDKQVPWENHALRGKFYFNTQPGAVSSASPGAVQTQRSEAERAWDEVKGSSNPAVLEAFARRFTDSFYGDLARTRLDELKRSQAEAKRIADEEARKRVAALTPDEQSVRYLASKGCSLVSGPGFSVNGRRYVVSSKVFAPTEDTTAYIKQAFGPKATIADWGQLKADLNTGNATNGFISGLNLPLQFNNDACANLYVSNNGSLFAMESRGWHYLMAHKGGNPGDWAVLDGINNGQLMLSRWNWPSQLLIVIGQ
jgi:hypothetical protein